MLSLAIPLEALAAAPVPTHIVVIGCGEPPLIDMYAEATGCAYPIFADPTRRLYDELGMVRTLAMGATPGYMRHISMWGSALRSIGQGLRVIPRGLALKGGNQRQVGGEFLFETKAGADDGDDGDAAEVTWCHRMKTTRDHAEADELQDLLGLEKLKAAAAPAEAKTEAVTEAVTEEPKAHAAPAAAPAAAAA